MKKLILVQNDYPATGKSTLTRCFSRYLQQFGAPHQVASLLEDSQDSPPGRLNLDGATLCPESFLDMLDSSPITILEIATGMGDLFARFYQNHGLDHAFDSAGIALSVVLPVTSDADSFDSVLEAAETYSDHAEYLIAHLVTSSYEDDSKVWDTSYAARVMDMFEAVELHIPEISFQIEIELRSQRTELSSALCDPTAEENLGKDFSKWLRHVMGQIDSTRQFLFAEAFKPTTAPKLDKKSRTRGRPKAVSKTADAAEAA